MPGVQLTFQLGAGLHTDELQQRAADVLLDLFHLVSVEGRSLYLSCNSTFDRARAFLRAEDLPGKFRAVGAV